MKRASLTDAVFWGFLAIVALAPLPYGSVHLWSASLLSVLVGAVLAAWAAVALIRPDACPVRPRHYLAPLLLVAPVLVWIALQACPAMPARFAHPVWAEAAAALGTGTATGIAPTVSLAPDATVSGLLRILTYAATFWIAMQLGADWRRASTAFWAIAAAGFAYAAYGLWAYLTQPGTILFAQKWAYQLSLTGTLVNRGHYALYAGFGLLVSFGMMIRYARRDASGAFESSIRFLHAIENLRLPVFLFLGGCLVIATALLLAQSRGGIVFTTAALVALVPLLLRAEGGSGGNDRRRSTAIMLAAIAAAGLLLFAVSGERFMIRALSPGESSGGRSDVYALTLRAIAAAPLGGHGIGSFPAVFHLYRDAAFPAISPVYTEAHSVYLEFASEAGIPAAVLYFSALAWIGGACLRAARRLRHHSVFPAIAAAAAVLAGLHSIFDFGLQVPGVAVTFAALLGIGYGQAAAVPPARPPEKGRT